MQTSFDYQFWYLCVDRNGNTTPVYYVGGGKGGSTAFIGGEILLDWSSCNVMNAGQLI